MVGVFHRIQTQRCEVNIREIKIGVSEIIASMQIKYEKIDGEMIQGKRRGEDIGTEHVITLEPGEYITGVAGIVCDQETIDRYISEITFFSQKSNGERVLYGPYGTGYDKYLGSCRLFAINGKIKSIYGRVRPLGADKGPWPIKTSPLGGIGFYYEDDSSYSQHSVQNIG